MRHGIAGRLGVGSLLLWVASAAGYFFFVWTVAGQAFDNAAYFGHDVVGRAALVLDAKILDPVSRTFVGSGVAILVGVAFLRRRWLTGLAVGVAVMVAVEGAEAFKKHLPRKELVVPAGLEPGYFKMDSYPSGHTTVGSSLAFGAVLVAASRWRVGVAMASSLVSAAYATGVLFLGWHRPSDAVGGILWAGCCLAAAACGLVLLRRGGGAFVFRSPAATVLSVLCGGLTVVGAWAACGIFGPFFPDADWPFFVMTTAIVATAFFVGAWLGNTLKALEEI